MNVNKVDGYSNYNSQSSNRVDKHEGALPGKKRTDSFERSAESSEPNYVKYPYGSYELAQAILATAAYRVEKRQPRVPIQSKDIDSYLVVSKSEQSASTHNNETHHYGSQQEYETTEECCEAGDDIEPEE